MNTVRTTKRIVAFISVLMMLISLMPCKIVLGASIADELWIADSEAELKSGFSTGNISAQKLFDREKNREVFLLNKGSATKYFNEVLTFDSKAKVLEFDIKPETKDANFTIYGMLLADGRIAEWDRPYGMFRLAAAEDKIGMTRLTDVHKFTYDDDYIPAELEKWYNIKLVFDAKHLSTRLYIDNEFIAVNNYPANWSGVTKKIEYLQFSLNSGSVSMVDLSIREIDCFVGQEIYNETKDELLADMAQPVWFDENIGPVGNIYTDYYTQKMTLKLIPKDSKPHKGTIELTVCDEQTGIPYSQSELTLDMPDPASPPVYEVDMHSHRYGTLILNVVTKDEQGNIIAVQDIPYSVVNIPPENVKNYICGLSFHPEQKNTPEEVYENGGSYIGDIETQMKLVDMAGFGTVRLDFRIGEAQSYNPITGRLNDSVKYTYDYLSKKNIDVLALGIVNFTLNAGDMSEETKKDFKAALECIKEYDNISQIELYNEPQYTDGLDEKSYTNLATQMSEIINEVKPQWKKMGTGGAAQHYSLYKNILDYGGKDIFDTVSLHSYTYPNSPERGGYVGMAVNAMAVGKNYGMTEQYVSEYGFSAMHPHTRTVDGRATTELWQAQMLPRVVLMTTLNQEYMKYIDLYTFMDYVNGNFPDRITSESHFGMIRAWKGEDVPYSAKAAYCSVANYNKIMTDAEYVGEIKYLDEEENTTAGYQFKLRDGEDCVILYNDWGTNENADLSYEGFKIDAPSVTAVDLFGNETELYPVDGIYNFKLTDSLQYIKGNFTTVVQTEPNIKFDALELSLAKGDVVKAKLENTSGQPVYAEIATSDGIGTEYDTSKAVTDKLDITISDTSGEAAGYVHSEVKDKDGRTVLCSETIVRRGEMMKAEFTAKPYNMDIKHWLANWSITNNMGKRLLNGKIVIKSPEYLKQKISQIEVKGIEPYQTKDFSFFIPEKLADGQTVVNVEADFIADTGEVTSINGSSDCHFMNYASRKPVIDGVIAESEWNDAMPLKLNKAEQTQKLIEDSPWWEGMSDCSAIAYPKWDENYLYLAVEVEDNVFGQNINRCIWGGDSIQIGTSDNKATGTYTELGAALIDGKTEMEFYITLQNRTTDNFGDGECVITRDGTKTYYELKMPWNVLIEKSGNIGENSMIAFSFLVNDNDGEWETGLPNSNGRRGYMEYCITDGKGAIGLHKDSKYFKSFLLIK